MTIQPKNESEFDQILTTFGRSFVHLINQVIETRQSNEATESGTAPELDVPPPPTLEDQEDAGPVDLSAVESDVLEPLDLPSAADALPPSIGDDLPSTDGVAAGPDVLDPMDVPGPDVDPLPGELEDVIQSSDDFSRMGLMLFEDRLAHENEQQELQQEFMHRSVQSLEATASFLWDLNLRLETLQSKLEAGHDSTLGF